MTGATVRKYRVLSVTRFCLLVVLAGCGDHRRQVRLPQAEPGQIQFQSYCAACHQYDGQRMGDAPALAGSHWVTGPASRLIRIVLHGVRGPMVVDGKTYDREMPGFGQILSDTQVVCPCCRKSASSSAHLPNRSQRRWLAGYVPRTRSGHSTGVWMSYSKNLRRAICVPVRIRCPLGRLCRRENGLR